MNLKVLLEPSDEGGFTAIVPSLPGCISEGDTRDEALANIREAIDLYLEPVDDDTIGMENAEQLVVALEQGSRPALRPDRARFATRWVGSRQAEG